MAIIFSDDINDKRDQDLSKRVDTLFDYIAYMKEQLEFWARNRTREISDADKKIADANARITDNADAIADLEPRIQAYENDIELGNTINVNKPILFDDGIQPKDADGVTGVEILPTRASDRLGGRIKLDRGEDTARDAYIDTYESNLRVVDRNPSTAVRASLDLSNGYLDVGGLYLTPNNYMDTNRIGLYPPSLSGGSISSGNSGNATSYWRVLKYSSSYKEIVSMMQLNVNFSSSYGSGYYANLTMMIPTTFFSDGSGNAHWQISANSHSGSGGGIYSGNVHSMNTSTGAIGFFLSNWVSGTINGLQVVLHGYKY